MRNAIRCCISCILPCGALDVVRIVHSNGRVEEISGTVRASEVMKAHPKHVLKKPSTSSPSEDGVVPKIVIVPPDAELQRGKIYFLMPLPPSSMVPPEKKTRQRSSSSSSAAAAAAKKKRMRDGGSTNKLTTTISADDHHLHHYRRRHRRHQSNVHNNSSSTDNCSNTTTTTASIAMANVNLLISDQYLSEILSEKLSTQRDRRRGRAGVWRPHLESISESPTDVC